jgi:hypothetical protein
MAIGSENGKAGGPLNAQHTHQQGAGAFANKKSNVHLAVNEKVWPFIKRNRSFTAALIVLGGILFAFPIFYLAVIGASCLDSPDFCICKYSGRLSQSENYWLTEAKPLSIVAHRWTGNSLEVAINNTAGERLTMTGFAIGSNTGPGGAYRDMSKTFEANQVLEMSFIDMSDCKPNSTYDANVTITYRSAEGIEGVQAGAKNIIGYCR